MKGRVISLALVCLPCAWGEPEIPEGSVLRLDPSELRTGPLAWAEDQSGSGNHFSQAESAHQPVVTEKLFGDRPGLSFGGDDFVECSPLSGIAPGDQPFHVFLVMRAEMSGSSPNPRLLDFFSHKENRRGFWVGHQNNGRNRLGISHGDEGEAASMAWDGQPHLLEVVYRGAQRWEQFLDGEFDGGGEFADRQFLGFAGPVSLTLGQHHDYRGANTYYRGDLAEVIVFIRPLADREQRQVGKMLADKFGLNTRYHGLVLGPSGLITDADRSHWAWQSLRTPAIPEVRGEAHTPLDAFVLARLEAAGLSISPPAPRTMLARRLALDLTGLPLPVAALREFLDDQSPGAVESLVDRLLASPRFGERWGRHWLDAAGYVDVLGVDNDAGTIKLGAGKWRYRDWVIRAFNQDMPFDQFLTAQLAGDELCDWREAEAFTPQMVELLVATGFLRVAADDTNEPEINTAGYHHDILQRVTETFASNVLGLTWQCAKCHDHKLDPIPQADYYRLEAFFHPAFNSRQWLIPSQREIADVPHQKRAEIDRLNGELKGKIETLQNERKALADKEDPATEGALKVLEEKIAFLESQKQSYGLIQAVYDVSRPPATRILKRGDHLQPGGEVLPALPEVLVLGPPVIAAVPTTTSSGRRTALARSLTDPDSPAEGLVARVQANRIWAHLFGAGLAPTTGNLGPSGAPPTHPELLDWLAAQFVADGWRFKPLIKRLVMSRTYQQGSEGLADSSTAHLLPRMRLRRLEAEAIRDSVLAVSGQLDLTMGGPPEGHEVQASGLVTIKGNTKRRSVYALARRNYHPTMLAVFDQPLQTTNCTGRTNSAVVTQSLAMLNSAFMLEQAGHFARRVEGAGENPQRVREAFALALSRPPRAEEIGVSVELLTTQEHHYRNAKKPDDEAQHLALRDFCQAVLNLNEFLYVL